MRALVLSIVTPRFAIQLAFGADLRLCHDLRLLCNKLMFISADKVDA